MMQNRSTTPDPIAALAQADILLLLAKLFSPPWLCDEDWATVCHQSGMLLDAAELGDDALKQLFEKTLQAAAATDPGDWSDEYTGLFEGAMPCPTGETAYIRRDKGAILADIVGFYHAFGFDTRTEAGEKADHLVGELEFLAMLLTMAAVPHCNGSAEDARTAEDAAAKFTADHLGQWLEIATNRLASLTSLTVYQSLAESAQAIWRALAARRGWMIPPSMAQMPEDENATPYECDMAPGETRVQLQVRGHAADLPH